MIETSILNIRDQRVQDLLWKYVVPDDIRPDYTKLDAIKFIESQIYAGNEVLIGNDKVILRCVMHNEFVVEPHILGEGIYIRSTIEQAIEFARHNTNMQRIVVWTHHEAIGRILEGCKFSHACTLNKHHLTSTGLHDLMCYTREIYNEEAD